MIGEALAHYKIVDKLGAGGMGEVYLAEDSRLQRRVALKVLPSELAEDRRRLERFEREAKALAALDHPNIVTVFSVEEARGVHFLTMAYVEGRTLDELVPSGGLPFERLLELAVPLADALRAAHEHGVVHRDLKPANVMVDGEGRLRVLDFGLAKLQAEADGAELSQLPTEGMTGEGVVLGTYPYMSPEQVEGRAVDARSDIFSLGVLLYEMATGERPFRGETPASLVAAILRETPRAVDEVRGDLPHHLGRILRRCLEKDPERRYQRAKDLLHELEDLRREVVTELPRGAAASPGPGRPVVERRTVYLSVAALAVVAAAVALYLTMLWPGSPPAPAASQVRSIAVLPLTNLMNDPEQEYFVDGMTEALIASLAKISALRVISRTSAMQYKGADKPLPEIARELGVDALIEGSVLRSGDEVRITAQLIDGRTDEHLWVETYDRAVEDVLAVHSEVARAVADQVQIALTGDEEARLAVPQVDPAAQEAYLKGNYFLNSMAVDQALEYFDLAQEEDPTFALPLAGRATAFVGAAVVGSTPPRLLYPEAEKAALQALELDDSLAEAHQALGWVRLWSDWDWPAAASRFRRAIELNPSGPMTRWGYSNYFLVMRQPEKAMAQAELARRLDPLSPIMQYGVVWNLYIARRYDEVLEQGQKVLEMFPDFEFVHALMMSAYTQKGLFPESLRVLPRADRVGGPWGPALQAVLDRGHDESDFVGVWRAVVEIVVAQSRLRYVSPGQIARGYAFAREREQALSWLEKMVEERDPEVVYLALDPAWDPVRSDPRFQDLVRRIGLPQ